ncbi:MAG: ACT domain-containing protein [Candidatus Dormibacteria bacterium]
MTATNLTIELDDRPGTLAELGSALGHAGVNLQGLCGSSVDGKAVYNLLVEDVEHARRAIESAGARVVAEREVLVVDIEDHPGAMGHLAGWIAAAGVNIDLLYVATATRLVIGADDLEAARRAIH